MKRIYTLWMAGCCLGLLLLSACNDCTTNVAQFDNGESSWTVYLPGDTLQMVDEQQVTYTFVNTRLTADPVPGEGFEVSDACIEQYDTRRASVMQEVSRSLPGLTVVAFKSPNAIRVNLVVINRGAFSLPDINTPQHEQLEINGATYSNVFEVVNEDTTAGSVQRILFNREAGFLSVAYTKGITLQRIP